MYEAQKELFEANFLRAELEADPRSWHLTTGHDGVLVAKYGKCCALSPSLLGEILNTETEPFVRRLASRYDVSEFWVEAALSGFDLREEYMRTPEHRDGYAWGQMMRKYLKPEACSA